MGNCADPRIKTYGKNTLEDATNNFVAKALIAKSRKIYSLALMHPRSKQDEFTAKYCKEINEGHHIFILSSEDEKVFGNVFKMINYINK